MSVSYVEKNGKYIITAFLGRDKNGKQIKKYKNYTPTSTLKRAKEKEVREYADKFEAECRKKLSLVGYHLTLEQYFDVYLNGDTYNNLSPYEQDQYEANIRNKFVEKLGNKCLSEITTSDIDMILQDMRKEGKSAKTIKTALTCIKSLMSYARRKNVILENPCDNCDVPKVESNNKIQFFTPEQAVKFLDFLEKDYVSVHHSHKRVIKSSDTEYSVKDYTEIHKVPKMFVAFFYLAIYSGCRRGELCALTWDDLLLDQKKVQITKSISHSKKLGQFEKCPKTKNGYRTISIPQVCIDKLMEWKKEEISIMNTIGSKWEGYRGKLFDKNRIFIQMDSGKTISLDAPYNRFKDIIKRFNAPYTDEEDKLPNISLHDLRHTNATLLISEGVDIETVSRRLGHSKPSITEDIYGHPIDANDEKAAKALEALLA